MTTKETEDINKAQFVQCLLDLANRANELGYNSLAPVLLVAAGSVIEGKGSMDTLAIWVGKYAELRLSGLPPLPDESENNS